MLYFGGGNRMTLSVSLSPKAEAKLKKRAAAEGKDPTAYASDLLERAVTAPTIDEILAPVRKDFAKTSMSEKEIMELGRKELRALRNEKKAKSA
jgi:hypothetical protein